MSFGFGVGDIITVVDRCNKIRRDFVDAPRQFQEITDEVRSLSIALQDVDVYLSGIGVSGNDLSENDRNDLVETGRGCHSVLRELSDIAERNRVLDGNNSEHSTNRGVKRIWKRLKWDPTDIRDLRGRISSSVALLNAFQNRIVRDSAAKLVRHAEDDVLQRILEWLSPVDYGPQQSDFIARRQPSTGQWLLNSEEFQKWVKTPSATMLSQGIPGAGKTIMAATVVDHLLSSSDLDGEVGIAYIYLNFRRQEDQKLIHLIASLVKQLTQQRPLEAEKLKSLYETHTKHKTRPSAEELLKVLHSIAASPSFSKIFIVVDALDECQSAGNCRSKLISELSRLQQGGKVNFFATSRFMPEVQGAFNESDIIMLEIRASDEDVQRYLECNLDELSGCVRCNPKLQEEIKTTISRAVDGMFLLAQIYVSSLDDKLTAKAVRTALKHFREQGIRSGAGEEAKLRVLSQAYDEAMERIQMQKRGLRELAENALTWIVSARRPLTTTEITFALAIDEAELVLDDDNIPELEDIISVSAGLVTVDEESNIVRLVHYTTQQYFERNRDHWFPDAEWNIAKASIAYMSTISGKKSPAVEKLVPHSFYSSGDGHPLYDYTTMYWSRHLAASPVCAQRSRQVIKFLQSDDLVKHCTADLAWKLEDLLAFRTKGLHLAAHFGLTETIEELLAENEDPDAPNTLDESDMTPIFYATRLGKVSTVMALIRHGATVDLESRDGSTPLAVAVDHSLEIVADILITNGASINHPVTAEWGLGEYKVSPLCIAADRGDVDMVSLLLVHGADVEFENKEGKMAMFYAASSGQVEVMAVLIDNGADVDSADGFWTTPLMEACSNVHYDAVRFLLSHGASVKRANKHGKTPMSMAAGSGSGQIVHALIEAGARIDDGDSLNQTPLLLAIHAGHTHLVEFFLSKGANVEAYRKFIHRYAFSRDPMMTDLTPLLAAAYLGCDDIAAVLIDYNADMEVRNAHGQTPLLLAASRSRYRVAKLLIKRGADIHATDREGKNSLLVLLEKDWKTKQIFHGYKRAYWDCTEYSRSARTYLDYNSCMHEITSMLVERGARLRRRWQRDALRWLLVAPEAPATDDSGT